MLIELGQCRGIQVYLPTMDVQYSVVSGKWKATRKLMLLTHVTRAELHVLSATRMHLKLSDLKVLTSASLPHLTSMSTRRG